MIEQMGRRLGAETRTQRVGVILGPGVNIKRSPLCGRNFEYYSEDPLLAGKCAAALIRGVQSNGIAACVKHFAANSQETLRMTSDSVMDERTLREIYLPAFEIAVKEGRVKCLMTSYNMLNGQYTNENEHLLQDILTREWGYDGLIVTDWGGDNDRVRGLIAGNSLEMPGTGGETDRQILEAVQSGTVKRELLDERVARLLRLVSDAEEAFGNAPGCDMAEHHEFAARFAEECAVLLKNEDGILPLRPGARIAVIGDFAKTPRYQGAGSSHIEPTKLECGLDALRAEGVNVIGFAPGFRRSGGESRRLREQACKLAESADTVLMWLGLDEGSEAEGVDRQHMRIAENQIRLLREVSEANPNIVVILSCGSPVETDWDKHVKALLHGYLGGQAGAKAIARLISGKSCPSGKLAETMPLRLSDTPCFIRYPGAERTSEYREGIFVGYRYYDTANKAVKYPFGFGLSYTSFEYTGLGACSRRRELHDKKRRQRAGRGDSAGLCCRAEERRVLPRKGAARLCARRAIARARQSAFSSGCPSARISIGTFPKTAGRLPADDTRSSSALRRAISACAAVSKSRATVRPTLTPAPFSRRTAMRRCSRCRMRALPRCSAARYRRICGTGMSRWSLIPRSCRALSDPASEDCFIAHCALSTASSA